MRIHSLTPLAPLALVAAAAAALPVAAQAATPNPPPNGRPHSRVVTYDRGEVRVLTLQAATKRVNGRLSVAATVRLRNLTDAPLTRYVRAGRCMSGSGVLPDCKADALFSVRLGAGETQTVHRTITLRQPPPGVDAIELAVQRTRTRPVLFFRTDGELLLKGNAWRGAGAGKTFGVAFPAQDDRAKRLSFDVPATSPSNAYVDVVWTGTAAPGAATTIAKCDGTACATPVPFGPARSRSGGQKFGDRFDLDIDGHTALSLAAADTDGTPLVTAALPWPTRPS
ncbi:hypothetical protein DSM104299_05365 [Baekduia alba]|uniref:hypothetical protein n=1 Tax=Baekduia alba TaxID=2997333 RepID=UPI00234069BE|nr:hypothetical protein [Baekduia alba]WCB96601.1 hypothetical protein DSM104299_05365 [Baekduia alba]